MDLEFAIAGIDVATFVRRVGDFAPLFGVPVLAAVIERPFFSAAGLSRNVIWYSIRANCVSFLIGGLVGGCFVPMWPIYGGLGFVLWLLIVIPAVSLIETWCVGSVERHTPTVKSRWILTGNVVSTMVCFAACICPKLLETPHRRVALQPYAGPAGLILAWSSIATIVAAFVIPWVRNRLDGTDAEKPATDDSPRPS